MATPIQPTIGKYPKKKFLFEVHFAGYTATKSIFDESKWMALSRMKKAYPKQKVVPIDNPPELTD